MNLLYPSARGFAKAMEAIWNIIDEGIFKIGKDQISLIAMDPSQISMIIFRLPKETFLEYEVSEPISVGIDIDYAKKILKRAKANEQIRISIEKGKLIMTFETDKSKREFRMPLLDLTEGVSKEPPIEYNNSFKIASETLKEIVEDTSIVSNYVKFVLDPDTVSIDIKSDTGEIREDFKVGEDVMEIKAETGARSLYPVQYLSDILKATRKSDIVSIYMETEKPLRLEFNLEGAFIRYYLAPASES
ncbi:MAG: proliferating cell nuclear antigen (pcna) [Candidatus Micrarchaeota archaeon]|nr:proliferating cell nuclear antigen (pcna) [Candidatus Micrarchaeota archaeon]